MKKFLLWAFVLWFLFPNALLQAQEKKWESLSLKSEPNFELPALKEQNFANGFKLFYLEQSDNPVIEGSIYLPWGKINEPDSAPGVAILSLLSLRQGGSGDLSPQEFELALNRLAAQISVEVTWEYGKIDFRCLKEDWEDLLALFQKMLFEPRWNQERFDILKKQLIASRKQADDQPEQVAIRYFRQVIYGKNSPWAREASVQDYEKLSLEQVKSFYKKSLSFSKAVLGLSSPFSLKKVRKDLSFLGNYKNPDYDIKQPKPITKEFKQENVWVKKDVSQATILMGHLG
ncbi:MAG: insulinase family protein [Deltaproteobacteria bacterium]|nr:insulinase family protein [Deltaproteobacteria bacterium]